MLRVELTKQLLRTRSLVALAALAALPVLFGLATAGEAGGRNGTQTGLYGAASYSALNHVAASVQFSTPLMLAVVVALVGSALGAADRDWGTLRYLYVRPVSRRQLVTGKWSALAACCLIATTCLIGAALAAGLVVFGWHPFHRLGSSNLSAVTAAGDLLAAGGYVTACMLSVGTLALTLGLLLPGPAEALGATVILLMAANIADGQPALHAIAPALPMHYWERWTDLLDGKGAAGLATGLAIQAASVTIALIVAWFGLTRRDPAA